MPSSKPVLGKRAGELPLPSQQESDIRYSKLGGERREWILHTDFSWMASKTFKRFFFFLAGKHAENRNVDKATTLVYTGCCYLVIKCQLNFSSLHVMENKRSASVQNVLHVVVFCVKKNWVPADLMTQHCMFSNICFWTKVLIAEVHLAIWEVAVPGLHRNLGNFLLLGQWLCCISLAREKF